ncbi:protein translocase subunit SecD [Zavarzinia sp. CC-PAN008]|uniref:protein translocase subunit SecD n=1 Tax=Zavarzinia sp. CC-PAN008 TaxID=3243332 RepID=UPI003F7441E0
MTRYPRWQLVLYGLIILLGIAFAAPNLLTREQAQSLPSWLPRHQLALGLDLSGGAHLMLAVDTKVVAQDRLESLVDSVRSTLRDARINYTGLGIRDGGVVVTVAREDQRAAAQAAFETLVQPTGNALLGTQRKDVDLSVGTDGQFRLAPTEESLRERAHAAVDQSLEIVRRRIDETGVAEPTISRQGDDQIVVQLPGVQDPGRIKALLGTTAKLTFQMVDTTVTQAELAAGRAPPGTVIMPADTTRAGPGAQQSYAVQRRVLVSGDMLVDAQPGFDPRTGEPMVSFRFNGEGAKRFGDATRANVNKPFAIVLDNKVISAPVIREPILGGSGQISGSFTSQGANDLAVLLRAGALPAPLQVIEERTVGADLGADSINAGVTTGIIGMALVVAFIVFLYGGYGLIANLALLLNLILTIAILSVLGATLTLPGIAGLVLSIGIAVDANVLINERIREETRAGKGALAALDAGFSRAYATIIDSNVTTLIATTLLFFFGAGPVRGFAVTIGIGIATSMFTAVTVVRIVMVWWVRRQRLKTLNLDPPLFHIIPDNTKIRFMRGRFAGIIVSAVLSIASVVLFFTPGLNYGIDFVGGTTVELRTEGPADLPALRSGLNTLGLGEVQLQGFGTPNDVLIRVERQAGDDAAQMAAVAAVRGKLAEIAPTGEIRRVEVVGPRVSGELMTTGALAVGLAFVAMLFYIWWRFEWQFAIGAIVTMILDLTKCVGFFAITGLDFNLVAIAALLTLIGYSVNDKVVIYDRMRENLRKYKTMPLRDLIDLSINQVLVRSVYNSATAFLAMLPMGLIGGAAVESFAIPLLFGIIVGTSSSIFIAAPILLFLGEGRLRRGTEAAQPPAAPVAGAAPAGPPGGALPNA